MLKIEAYKFIPTVTKIQFLSIYSFRTAEGKTWLSVDPPSGPFRVKILFIGHSRKHPCDNIQVKLHVYLVIVKLKIIVFLVCNEVAKNLN